MVAQRSWKRLAVTGAALGGGAMMTSLAMSGMAAYFARRIVTPDRTQPNNVHVTQVTDDSVTFKANPDTTEPGRYGVWGGCGATHARVGVVTEHDDVNHLVTRELIGVDQGTLVPGPARWNAYYLMGTPLTACGTPYVDVVVESSAGILPTWYIPPQDDRKTPTTWAICVHGRGATREECLRAVPVLHQLGLPVIVSSYRNSTEGPMLGQGRYSLGATEWADVEAAVKFALHHGAQRVMCFGWSMGAAIILQMVSRSEVADHVQALVLDSPVIDWTTVVHHQARIHKIPAAVGHLGMAMLRHKDARRLVGTAGPVDFDRLDWVGRAAELHLPILIMHSDADQTVPNEPSKLLARARPDLVRYLDFPGARHTRGWNTDPGRWEREVARYVLEHL